MDSLFWPVLIVVSKWGIYAAMIVLLGSFYWQQTVGGRFESSIVMSAPSLIAWSIIGLVSVVLQFFSQTGMLADDGVQGAVSSFMMQIVWSTGAGDATRWRAIGFILALFAILASSQNKVWKVSSLVLQLSAGAALIGAFLFTGHTAEMSPWYGALLTTHVLVAVWWFGALLPMRKACQHDAVDVLLPWLVRFGEQASVLVLIMAVMGVVLAYAIVGTVHNLLFTGYGWLLMLKVLLFCGILLLAARHKLSLVPAIHTSGDVRQFVASLNVEIVVAAVLLAVTSVLTSLVGV